MDIMSAQPTSQVFQYPQWVITSGLVVAVFSAYAWLQAPWLAQYALQAFAVGVLLFFATKFVSSRKQLSAVPTPFSLELVPLTFALLLLIGSTGSADSGFFPLIYVLLLLLVLTTGFVTTVITTAILMLFVYATSSLVSTDYWQAIISIPLMVLFFLYTEQQMNKSKIQSTQLQQDQEKLVSAQSTVSTLADYLRNFLRPKLITLIDLGSKPDTPKSIILNQLSLLLSETEKLETKIVQSPEPSENLSARDEREPSGTPK